jgi:hypothetical protein
MTPETLNIESPSGSELTVTKYPDSLLIYVCDGGIYGGGNAMFELTTGEVERLVAFLRPATDSPESSPRDYYEPTEISQSGDITKLTFDIEGQIFKILFAKTEEPENWTEIRLKDPLGDVQTLEFWHTADGIPLTIIKTMEFHKENEIK